MNDEWAVNEDRQWYIIYHDNDKQWWAMTSNNDD